MEVGVKDIVYVIVIGRKGIGDIDFGCLYCIGKVWVVLEGYYCVCIDFNYGFCFYEVVGLSLIWVVEVYFIGGS